jgi:hypothetical protein
MDLTLERVHGRIGRSSGRTRLGYACKTTTHVAEIEVVLRAQVRELRPRILVPHEVELAANLLEPWTRVAEPYSAWIPACSTRESLFTSSFARKPFSTIPFLFGRRHRSHLFFPPNKVLVVLLGKSVWRRWLCFTERRPPLAIESAYQFRRLPAYHDHFAKRLALIKSLEDLGGQLARCR